MSYNNKEASTAESRHLLEETTTNTNNNNNKNMWRPSLNRTKELLHNFIMLLLIVVALLLMQQQMATVSGMPLDEYEATTATTTTTPVDRIIPAAGDDIDEPNHSGSSPSQIHTAAKSNANNEISQRLHKRHSDFATVYHMKIRKSIETEWLNPCRGVSVRQHTNNNNDTLQRTTLRRRRTHRALRLNPEKRLPGHRRRVLRDLKLRLNTDYRTFVAEHGSIRKEIAKFAPYHYKCLPKLMASSKVSLRRIYRDLQYYTAYFAYFERVQMHWDLRCLQYESAPTKELHTYSLHSRSILCEIERAINQTVTHPAIPTLSRSVVESRMDFNTTLPEILHKIEKSHRKSHTRRLQLQRVHYQRHHEANNEVTPPIDYVVNRMDVLYLKHHYLKYLGQTLKLLRSRTHRMENKSNKKTKKKKKKQQNLV